MIAHASFRRKREGKRGRNELEACRDSERREEDSPRVARVGKWRKHATADVGAATTTTADSPKSR